MPAYTTVDNLFSLIDTFKRKSKSEDEAKAIFGKGESAYQNSKSALRAFGFIEKDSLNFTDEGREIAFSQDSGKKAVMLVFGIMKTERSGT
ncbi:MAG: hypothetical protein ACM3XR_02375 [Bacillota bacterium]